MERDDYLREIESLVLHLSPQAQLLGEMDLHVAEQLWRDQIPLDTALAGIRKGADRLAKLKSPPRGLPLRRVRSDIDRVARKVQQNLVGAQAAAPAAASEAPQVWPSIVGQMADEVTSPWSERLADLSARSDLGEERAFLRLVTIARDYYADVAGRLSAHQRAAMVAEVEQTSAQVLDRMSPAAREDLLDELVRRRLMTQDPVLDPQRFWQE